MTLTVNKEFFKRTATATVLGLTMGMTALSTDAYPRGVSDTDAQSTGQDVGDAEADAQGVDSTADQSAAESTNTDADGNAETADQSTTSVDSTSNGVSRGASATGDCCDKSESTESPDTPSEGGEKPITPKPIRCEGRVTDVQGKTATFISIFRGVESGPFTTPNNFNRSVGFNPKSTEPRDARACTKRVASQISGTQDYSIVTNGSSTRIISGEAKPVRAGTTVTHTPTPSAYYVTTTVNGQLCKGVANNQNVLHNYYRPKILSDEQHVKGYMDGRFTAEEVSAIESCDTIGLTKSFETTCALKLGDVDGQKAFLNDNTCEVSAQVKVTVPVIAVVEPEAKPATEETKPADKEESCLAVTAGVFFGKAAVNGEVIGKVDGVSYTFAANQYVGFDCDYTKKADGSYDLKGGIDLYATSGDFSYDPKKQNPASDFLTIEDGKFKNLSPVKAFFGAQVAAVCDAKQTVAEMCEALNKKPAVIIVPAPAKP